MTYKDEIVYDIDASQPKASIHAQMEANRQAKLRRAERREQERFDAPGIFDTLAQSWSRIACKYVSAKQK